MNRQRNHHRHFFIFILIIVFIGFFIFLSASLGLLNRDGASYQRVVLNQFVILIGSIIVMLLVGNYDYHRYRRLTLILFLSALAINLLVFVPGIGFKAGGAARWISIGNHTFQPSELLKLGFIIYLAAWLTRTNSQLSKWQYGLFPFLILIAVVGLVLINEPDLGTFFTLLATAILMFFTAGGQFRHLLLSSIIAVVALAGIIATKPYARTRILTYLHPEENTQTSSYQVKQSLITIGSGGLWGRGFGQSVQKFHYLPEPIGDSIFAVAAEEFGFLGSALLVLIFVIFTLWGLGLAARAPDRFGRVLIVGVLFLTSIGAFLNIGSMLGLIPLTGLSLVFVGHGGSSLLFSLIGCGIILNIAKQSKKILR